MCGSAHRKTRLKTALLPLHRSLQFSLRKELRLNPLPKISLTTFELYSLSQYLSNIKSRWQMHQGDFPEYRSDARNQLASRGSHRNRRPARQPEMWVGHHRI